MLLTVVAAFIGAVALSMGVKMALASARAQSWPTVPGRVLEKSVGRTIGRGRTHALRVKYVYAVEGKDYESARVHLLGEVGYPDAQARIDALPDPVPVHYDPADPSRSFLLPMPASTTWIAIVLGAVVLAVASLGLLVQVAQR